MGVALLGVALIHTLTINADEFVMMDIGSIPIIKEDGILVLDTTVGSPLPLNGRHLPLKQIHIVRIRITS
jgi:hypothetical protein